MSSEHAIKLLIFSKLIQVYPATVEIDCSRAIIQKSYSTSKPHIGDLPNEMLYQIAQALVGPNLSYKALSWLSMTCKAWYGVVNDDDLWRKGCEQLWDKESLTHLIGKHHSFGVLHK